MIKLPDFEKVFEYENNFYLSCNIDRIAKLLGHYELYKMIAGFPGSIVECGVFKGASLSRFAIFRSLLGGPYSRKIIGFDTFDKFPVTRYAPDKVVRKKAVKIAGADSISKEQMMSVLSYKGVDKYVELVEGDIKKTVPAYIKAHPELRIALLNLDVDMYEPSVAILKYLYPRVVKGGLLLLDDYASYSAETSAVEEYFKDKDVEIKKLPFCMTPSYIIKK